MKRILTFLCCAVALSVQAQDYPCKKQIEQGHYDKAKAKIEKQLEKVPNNTEYLYAFYRLCTDELSPYYNVREAYGYLAKAQILFARSDEKTSAKLQKKGFGAAQMASDIARASGLCLAEAARENTVEAFAGFLTYCTAAPDSLQQRAVAQRNALAFAEAKAQDTEEGYNRFLAAYPDAREVGEAVVLRNAAAYASAEGQHTIAAYRHFLSLYPEAAQAEAARAAMSALAFAQAAEQDTEEAYRLFVQEYPGSKEAAEALARADQRHYETFTQARTAAVYRAYMEQYPERAAQQQQARAALLQLAVQSADKKEMAACLPLADNEQKPVLLRALHDVMAAESADSLRLYYTLYDPENLIGLWQQDSVALATSAAPAALQAATSAEEEPAAEELAPVPAEDPWEKQATHEDSLYRYPAEADIDSLKSLGALHCTSLSDGETALCYLCYAHGKAGIVTDDKRVCVPFAYDKISRLSDYYSEYFFTRKGDKVGLLYRTEEIYPPVMNTIWLNPPKVALADGSRQAFGNRDEFEAFGAKMVQAERLKNTDFHPTDSGAVTLTLDRFNTDYVYSDGMLAVQDFGTGLWGFVNDKGEMQIKPQFTSRETPCFHHGYCVLTDNNRLKIINKQGKVQATLPAACEYLSSFNENGIAFAKFSIPNDRLHYRYAFVNPQGKEVYASVYGGKRYEQRYAGVSERAYPFHDGVAFFYDGYPNKPGACFGLYNKSGKVVKKAAWSRVHDFSEGLAAVEQPAQGNQPAKWGFVGTKGEWVIPAQYSNEPSDFHEGYALVQKSNGNWVYINRQGEVVSPEYVGATAFYHGHAFVKEAEHWRKQVVNKHFTVIRHDHPLDINHQEIVPMPYQSGVLLFRHGLFVASPYGYANRGKNTVLDAVGDYWEFDLPFTFTTQHYSDELIHVEYKPAGASDAVDAFMDYTGRIVWILKRNEF